MISIDNALPLLIIVVVSFLSFYFIETVILFFLNRFIRKHWEIVVDTLMRAIVRRKNMVKITVFSSLALVVTLLVLFTPIVEILIGGEQVLRLLAMTLLTTMLAVYWIGSRTIGTVVIEQRIHLYIYIVLSLISFSAIMWIAQTKYTLYEIAINEAFVQPIVENIEEEYEQKLEERMLRIFRSMVNHDDCEYIDYAEMNGEGLTQFIFVRKEPMLAEENPVIRPQGAPLEGKKCVLETNFLLTPEGKWYQVLEQEF